MEKRHYQTTARAALIEYLKAAGERSAQSVDEVCRGLDGAGYTPGRSTVYRLLGELCETGEVRKFRADAESEGYVYQYVGKEGDCDCHFHLQCVSCGKISHLKCKCSEDIRSRLMETHGFAVDSGRSVLYGTCAICAGKGAI